MGSAVLLVLASLLPVCPLDFPPPCPPLPVAARLLVRQQRNVQLRPDLSLEQGRAGNGGKGLANVGECRRHVEDRS